MDQITCPHCSFRFPIDEGLDFEIRQKYRNDSESELKQKEEELKRKLEKEILEKLQKESIEKDEELQRVKRELDDRKKQYELEVNSRDLEISNKVQEREYEISKKHSNELQRVREESKKDAQNELENTEKKYQQLLKENEIKSREEKERLQRQIEDMKGTLVQTSPELTGEIQELELEELLGSRFQSDVIEPVPRGIKGADVIQQIYTPGGPNCGKILWESKKTKQWSEGWIDKLKEDRRDSGSDVAILVTTAMPRGEKGFTLKGDVIVTEFQYATVIAVLTRENLIRLAKANISQTGRLNKESLIYDYVTGRQFREMIQAIVDSWSRAKKDLDDEKKALTRIWSKRYKELEMELLRLAGIYGDIQAIAGNSLEDIAGFSLLSDKGEDGD